MSTVKTRGAKGAREPREPKLGVLGGMGPQATQVFYQYVLDRTEASCDQEHLPALILSDTGVPDRTASILTGNTEPMYQRLLADARLLEECGCTVIAIPCNTSHYFVDRIQQEIGIPIHLHTHNTTDNQIATYLMAAEAGVDVVDAPPSLPPTAPSAPACIRRSAPPSAWRPPLRSPLSSVWSCPSSTRRSNGGSGAAGRNLPRSTALWPPWAVTAPFWAAPSCPSSAATTACPPSTWTPWRCWPSWPSSAAANSCAPSKKTSPGRCLPTPAVGTYSAN